MNGTALIWALVLVLAITCAMVILMKYGLVLIITGTVKSVCQLFGNKESKKKESKKKD